MKRVTAILIAMLWLTMPGSAWSKPRHWYSDPKFWMGEAVIAGALIADGATTVNGLHRGMMETNPILGAHPSTARVAGYDVTLFAGYTAANAAEHHLTRNESKPWRVAGYVAIPAIAASAHGYAAIHNSELK